MKIQMKTVWKSKESPNMDSFNFCYPLYDASSVKDNRVSTVSIYYNVIDGTVHNEVMRRANHYWRFINNEFALKGGL